MSTDIRTIRIACQGAASMDIAQMSYFQGDLKSLSEANFKKLREEIVQTGFAFPINIWSDGEKNYIVGGHQRWRVLSRLREEGWQIPEIPIVKVEASSIQEARRRVLQDVSQYGKIETQGLYEFMTEAQIQMQDLKGMFDLPEIDLGKFEAEFFADPSPAAPPPVSLADKFLVPPFSILDARQGYWQDRKQEWLKMGIQSEVGRGDNLLKFSDTIRKAMSPDRSQFVNGVLMKSDSGNDPRYYFKKQEMERKLGRELSTEEFQRDYYEGPDSYASGTSIFDPVLCELIYRWFCGPGATVIDPFAGGSVRGIVASKLGRKYVGCELRKEQVEANYQQAADICKDHHPVWIQGDSRQADLSNYEADLVFSCPPYYDLEVYSDDPADLSNMPFEKFIEAYNEIIARACARLRDNRFAAFVVGDVRDEEGKYRNFVSLTIDAFQRAGLKLYNEAILVTAVGSIAMRAARPFELSRKLGKAHQNVLVFVKGDPKLATAECGFVEVGELAVGDGEQL